MPLPQPLPVEKVPDGFMGVEAHNAMVDVNEAHAAKLDDEFYPPFPKPLTRKGFAGLALSTRKKRFLQSFDASGGIIGIACKDADVDRDKYDEWMKEDPEFAKKFRFKCADIADRARFIMHQRTGLIKGTRLNLEYKRISDHLLAFTVKNLCPEIYGDKVSANITLEINIPRPTRPVVGGQIRIPTDDAAKSIPHLPS